MPQVTILEGGKPKSFAGVDKLQIALSGGGTSLWVPKDTRLLTALTANVNGTYPPPEGYFGFDTVIVNVPPSQVAGIDPETGQYVLIGTKPSKPDDDDYPVWPTDPTVPDDPWDPDTEGGNDWDPYEVPDGGEWTPPWDDPDTEDEWPDNDVPEMVKTHIPSGIKIVNPPNKTVYTAGEAMDYTGIRVQLLDENGQPFSNERYANTFIPYSELVFPIPYSPHAAEVGYESDLIDEKVETHGGWSFVWIRWRYDTVIENGAKFAMLNITSQENDYIYASDTSGIVSTSTRTTIRTGETRIDTITSTNRSATYNGKTVYYVSVHSSVASGEYTESNIPIPYTNPAYGNDADKIAWTMVYGKVSGGNAIPVQWVSPYDGKTYTDSFAITVNDATNQSDPEGGGGGFSGGGGEGIGGEGGGGGF